MDSLADLVQSALENSFNTLTWVILVSIAVRIYRKYLQKHYARFSSTYRKRLEDKEATQKARLEETALIATMYPEITLAPHLIVFAILFGLGLMLVALSFFLSLSEQMIDRGDSYLILDLLALLFVYGSLIFGLSLLSKAANVGLFVINVSKRALEIHKAPRSLSIEELNGGEISTKIFRNQVHE